MNRNRAPLRGSDLQVGRSGRTVAFTVADPATAANAGVLLDDLQRLHPSWDRVVVSSEAIDRRSKRSPATLVLTASEIGMPEALAFAVGLPPASALAAIVPWAFESLFARGYRRVIFLGPFVRCYAPLTEVSRALAAGDAVLVPRVLQPFADSLTPGARDLRASGLFDTSLVGLAATPATTSVVRRWMDAWRSRWLHPDRGEPDDPSGAILEMLPAVLARTAILRDPGYQVSLWNLHHRELAQGGRAGTWRLLAGPRLRTINFAGLVAASPAGSSLHREAWPTWLHLLVNEYGERLRGSSLGSGRPESRVTLDRLLPIPPAWRHTVLDAPAVKGALLTATSPASARALLHEFLRLPDSDLPDLPRLLAEAYRQLPELRRHADGRPAAEMRAALDAWHAGDGWRTCPVQLAPARRPAAHASRRPTVNLFGYFTSQSGLAEAARSTARALAAPVADCRNVNYVGGSPSLCAQPRVALSLPAADPVLDIVHVNCDAVSLFHGTHPEVWNRRSYKIGYWLWELETLPALAHDHARLFNEIWCASTFNQRCFEQLGNAVVRLAPLLVNPDLARMARSKPGRALDAPLLSRPHVFLTVSDFFSCPERKNPVAAIEAYLSAFPRDNGETGLLVKVSNTRIRPDYLETLRRASRGRRDVRFLLDNLDAAALARLVARSAALVSLHTTEGYGLPVAEALALGRPVIATGYGGNVDFCQGSDAHLVGYRMVTLDRRLGPYDRGTRWASPDLDDAARAYRAIYERRRRHRDAFLPRVSEFNRAARRLYRRCLEAAVERAAVTPGVRLASTRLKVAVFGAGAGGERLAHQLLRRHDVVCFLDNDRTKAGGRLLGLPVLSPDQIGGLDVERILIGSVYHTEIRDQLMALGVPPDKMSLHPRGILADLAAESDRTTDSTNAR